MKYFTKIASFLMVGGMAAIVPAVSHAYTFTSSSTVTAAATVTGGSTAMSIAILNRSNNAPAANVSWPTINAGAGWTLASQYVQITSTLSIAGSGIQTYTNNTLSSASPQYSGPVSSTTAAGLVNAANTTETLQLAWHINATTTPLAADDPNCTGAAGQPTFCSATPTGYAWFYYADRAGGLMQNAPANFYVQVERAGGVPQIQFAQTSFGPGSANGINNLFLEANFQLATGGSTYQTSTLTVELFNP